MQAMNGSASRGQRRGRMIVCAIALLALSAIVMPSVASAKPVKSTYLALGDSLAFGYSQQLFNECESKGESPTCFENGYVNDYYNLIKGKAKGIQLINDGCPGETTESFIGTNLPPYLNGALHEQEEAERAQTKKEEEKKYEEEGATKEEAEAKSPGHVVEVTGESPCAYQKKGLPLHHPYASPEQSQLENALQVLKEQSLKGTPVSLITLNIGANDELHFLAACTKKAEKEVGESAAEGKYNKQVEEEIAKGEFTAEEGAGTEPADKERGEKDAKKDGEAKGKKCVEDGASGLFAQIAKNTTGILLTIRHGSSFGSVDYEGPILYQGGYNPFGEVFAGMGEEVPGSNELAGVENLIQRKVTEAFGACFSDPQSTFNPRNSQEPERLQKYTNQANFTETNGKKNGPDIHPTPEGYKVLAKLLRKETKKQENKGQCV